MAEYRAYIVGQDGHNAIGLVVAKARIALSDVTIRRKLMEELKKQPMHLRRQVYVPHCESLRRAGGPAAEQRRGVARLLLFCDSTSKRIGPSKVVDLSPKLNREK